MSQDCFLRPASSRHPDITLPDNTPVDLGRGPLTKVKDSRCSRNQLKLTADYSQFRVKVEQVGANASTVKGSELGKGGNDYLGHDESLELLKGEYGYTVLFNPKPPKLNGSGKKEKKRKMSDDQDVSNGSKRTKVEVDSGHCSKRRKGLWKLGGEGKVMTHKDGKEWKEAEEGKLLVMTCDDCEPREKIAAYDIDGTIITTQSGKVFPVDANDWRLLYSEVPGKLKSLYSSGYKIVFITNQAGIAKGKVKVEDFKTKVERIQKKVGIPLQVFISTADQGYFRKPRMGIWEWLETHGNGDVSIDMSTSFYCGDAAGREKDWTLGKKKDFSCSDRLLAVNLGFDFQTPEQHFLGKKPTTKFILPDFDPRSYKPLPLLEPTNARITSGTQEMIVMVGIQGSGKSFVSTNILKPEGYVVASNDQLGGREKTMKVAEQELGRGNSVVVDNTHVDKEARKKFLDIARKMNIPVRCFLMNTSHGQARHNNLFRELTDPSHTRIKEMLINVFRTKFQPPELDEGFVEIVKVNCVPKFNSDREKDLYSIYLLEK